MGLNDRIKYAEMKARHQKLLLPWFKKWWGIVILVLIGLFLVGLITSGIYIWNEVKRIQSEEANNYLKTQREDYLKLIAGSGGYSLGAVNPKITIIEFSDFGCPFCKESAPVIRKLMEKYKDTVKLVIRDYPIHDNSIDLAIAAHCAGAQGKYWEAYDSLFAEQDNLKDTGDALKANLLAWAEILKLDTTKFEACFNNRTDIDLIKKDYDDGNELKIQGTPTWFVNNYPITGAYTADKFEELFTGILKQTK